MKEIKNAGAQGDVFFVRMDGDVPLGVKNVTPTNGCHILAHSETGHHHTVRADGTAFYEGPSDPFTCYLRVDGEFADVVHHRTFDTHDTVRLTRGTWMVRRQREYTPEGFRRVED